MHSGGAAIVMVVMYLAYDIFLLKFRWIIACIHLVCKWSGVPEANVGRNATGR